MKQISSKRVKTDADHEELSRLEFLSSLYLAADGPIIPAANIDAMLLAAAKKSKEGQICKSAVFCTKHVSLEYNGPRSADELWSDDSFRHMALVRVGSARIVRTRPLFEQWSAQTTINVENTIVNPQRIVDWMNVAGSIIGLGDWRPQHGRFEAKSLV